jgi:hypothetical protein
MLNAILMQRPNALEEMSKLWYSTGQQIGIVTGKTIGFVPGSYFGVQKSKDLRWGSGVA